MNVCVEIEDKVIGIAVCVWKRIFVLFLKFGLGFVCG